ncbi:hypothetical protein M0R72_15420 [Candidatus Pacearchaeota archaeon]|jgi:hypothetical protein|nr:hypothetical protein [Candidatus Pacearchaeota archaeon]
MFRIEAPNPHIQTTTVLPSPSWGDVYEPAATVKSLRSMNGTLYTYTQSKNKRKKCHWDFKVSRNKALELKAFYAAYYGSEIKITDHDGVIWIGYFQNNPFELSGAGRAPSFPGGEVTDLSIDFEESE